MASNNAPGLIANFSLSTTNKRSSPSTIKRISSETRSIRVHMPPDTIPPLPGAINALSSRPALDGRAIDETIAHWSQKYNLVVQRFAQNSLYRRAEAPTMSIIESLDGSMTT